MLLFLLAHQSPKIISEATTRTCLQFRKTLHLNSSAVFSGAAILAMHPTTPSQLLSRLSAIIITHAKTQFPGLQVHALNNLYFFPQPAHRTRDQHCVLREIKDPVSKIPSCWLRQIPWWFLIGNPLLPHGKPEKEAEQPQWR